MRASLRRNSTESRSVAQPLSLNPPFLKATYSYTLFPPSRSQASQTDATSTSAPPSPTSVHSSIRKPPTPHATFITLFLNAIHEMQSRSHEVSTTTATLRKVQKYLPRLAPGDGIQQIKLAGHSSRWLKLVRYSAILTICLRSI